METERMAALLAPFLGGAVLSQNQLAQFSSYLELLLRWNARMNLTAVREPEQIAGRHFGESLFAARNLYPEGSQLTGENWLLDVGSGAGFPGLPVKIWAPELRLTLIESQHRKAVFLREAVRTVGLQGVEVVPVRAEDFPFPAASGKAETLTITLRAVERFQQVLPAAGRLLSSLPATRRRLALLIGAAQVEPARQLLPGVKWSEPLAIPQSSNRVLLVVAV